ncbi:MAG: hypothetical protein WCF60_03770 [Anaerobacillus sp.]
MWNLGNEMNVILISILNLNLPLYKNNSEVFATSYEEEKKQPVELYKKRLKSQDSVTIDAFEGDKLVYLTVALKKK